MRVPRTYLRQKIINHKDTYVLICWNRAEIETGFEGCIVFTTQWITWGILLLTKLIFAKKMRHLAPSFAYLVTDILMQSR